MSNLLKPVLEAEWHQLELNYQHLRKHTQKEQQRLMLSIHSYGLLEPIMVIAAATGRWVVIDGYLRIKAMQALKSDAIKITVWESSVAEALIHAYRNNQSRIWDYFEEACLLQELMSLHNYSQVELAQQLGKSKSWVSYRLQLLESLPDFIRDAILQGYLSAWTASRVLVPFARANQDAAKRLLSYLVSHTHSTRELQEFYHHYLKSNNKIREQLLISPQLFFKALEFSKKNQRLQKDLSLSPQVTWEEKLEEIGYRLDALQSMFHAVFYPQQNEEECSILKKCWQKIFTQINTLNRRIYEPITFNPSSTPITSSGAKQT
jgi:ParB family transcriptional regulator, chromosome partitioning protein